MSETTLVTEPTSMPNGMDIDFEDFFDEEDEDVQLHAGKVATQRKQTHSQRWTDEEEKEENVKQPPAGKGQTKRQKTAAAAAVPASTSSSPAQQQPPQQQQPQQPPQQQPRSRASGKKGAAAGNSKHRTKLPTPLLPPKLRIARGNTYQEYEINDESCYILLTRRLFLSLFSLAIKILTPVRTQNNVVFYIDVDPGKENGFQRCDKQARQEYSLGFRSTDSDTSIFTEAFVSSKNFEDMYCPNSLCLIFQQDALSSIHSCIDKGEGINGEYVLMVIPSALTDTMGRMNSNMIDIFSCGVDAAVGGVRSEVRSEEELGGGGGKSTMDSPTVLRVEEKYSIKIAEILKQKTIAHGFDRLDNLTSLPIELYHSKVKDLERLLTFIGASKTFTKNSAESSRSFFLLLESNNLLCQMNDGLSVNADTRVCNFVDAQNRLGLDRRCVRIMFNADRIFAILNHLPRTDLLLRIPFSGRQVSYVSFEADHDFGKIVISVASKEIRDDGSGESIEEKE